MPVSPERLWEALTDPEQLAGWFGGRIEWEMREGGQARFRDDDGSVRIGTVEAVRPGRHLRFRWWPAGRSGPAPSPESGAESGAAAGAASGPADGEESEVSYLLEPVENGDATRLTVQERQVRPAAAPQARAGDWSQWDTRLAGAWVSTQASTVGAGARA
jgi:uncharacterized protein YndB with AHSA1/START domain